MGCAIDRMDAADGTWVGVELVGEGGRATRSSDERERSDQTHRIAS
jgi:hypothetical protein